MDDKKRIDPIWAAMREARGFKELDVSCIDWQALSNNLSLDVAFFNGAHKLGDRNLHKKRDERTNKFRRFMSDAKKLYQADLKDERLISRHYPRPPPDLLAVIADLERAAERALESIKNTARLQQTGDQTFIELTSQKFLYAVTKRMAQTFESHFKVEATSDTSRNESPRRDGPFLRMAQFALREYGDEEYKLSSIATELDKIRAKATKKPKTVPATHAKSR